MNTFRVWAPYAKTVSLVRGGDELVMVAAAGGWWRAEGVRPRAGEDYGYRIDGAPVVYPDPRSMRQPAGVHAPSRVVDPGAFTWTDVSWQGRQLTRSVLYELHIGTFTPGGTFDSAIERLPYLVDLGIDAVEVLPVAAVAGRRNWGYDGVGLYAVTENYGGPEAFVRFIDAAHSLGLAVVLDVVYNHLGPSGNYLPQFGPYFSAGHNAWGQTVNLDGPDSDEVRRFVVDNALMWVRDYHLDGLRLDAIHALVDTRATHILEQLSTEIAALGADLGREVWLIAESGLNDPRVIRDREHFGYGMSAQWDDDVHHALHATLTGERQGYYVDFGSLPTLAKALAAAFVHDGGWSTFRKRSHGRPVGDLPGDRFVVFLQDHDQIGNRAQGDRLGSLVSPGLLKVGAALLLCSPYTPMLFMGEEWGSTRPWLFFCDPDSPELAMATREGRRAEFATHGWEPGDVADPVAATTFDASILDWSEPESGWHTDVLAWYRSLIALRRRERELTDPRRDLVGVRYDTDRRWFVMNRGRLAIVANLADQPQEIDVGLFDEFVIASEARTSMMAISAGTVQLPGESVAILRR